MEKMILCYLLSFAFFRRKEKAMIASRKKSTTRDMTSGPIVKRVLLFALPLMLGNIFQMLYNTVDSVVVGNFVGTEALAAVGSTTMIINMLVFFFNGFAIGAGVVIGRYFGARDMKELHKAIETTMAATFVMSVIFTVVGVLGVEPMLRFMSTPEDVFGEASVYLRIYNAGFSGLLIYNMGSGILRAVGDTTRPLYFLILTSVLNIILDLLFVLVFHMGIAGVALATIISQFISAILTLMLLTGSRDVYRLTWNDLRIDRFILGRIVSVGLPAGIQSVITAFSNVFVQSYINFFGSGCMAGWSCFNKLDQFIMLPMQSMAMASTTFVSQNIGAGKTKRAEQGTYVTIGLTLLVTAVILTLLQFFAASCVSLFTRDQAVIEYGTVFVHTLSIFMLFNCVNHVLAGALRGMGDSRGPMIIMLFAFVVIRQTYLFLMTHYFSNTPVSVGMGYPVGWTSCCVIEVCYFLIRRKALLGKEN